MTQMPTPAFNGLYGDLIMEHFRNPRNRDPIDGAQVEAAEFNPFCGDRVELQLGLDALERVDRVSARSEGCSIIQASASMLSDSLDGMTLEQVDGLAERFRTMMLAGARGDLSGPDEDLGDLQALEVVRQYRVRIKCALLPWTALQVGLERYRAERADSAGSS